MNNIDNKVTDQRGIILTDNVDLNWVNSLTPRYHKEYVKFVVDVANNKVVIGMDVHADAEILLGTDSSSRSELLGQHAELIPQTLRAGRLDVE